MIGLPDQKLQYLSGIINIVTIYVSFSNLSIFAIQDDMLTSLFIENYSGLTLVGRVL